MRKAEKMSELKRRRMRAIALAAAVLASGRLWAEEPESVSATFADIAGKVEYQRPGSAWTPAKAGDSIDKGTVVSTGFKSSATLKLGEATLFLKSLTRLSLEDLVRTSGGTQTKLYLLSGRVKADVPREAGKTNDFRVRSPTATASVRGTAFDFDGMNLIVSRGKVQYQTPTSQFRLVGAQEFAFISANGTVAPPTAVTPDADLSQAAALADQSGIQNFAPPPSAPPVSQRKISVTITVQ